MFSTLWKTNLMFEFIIVTHHVKRDLTGIAKNIDPGLPAWTAQADNVLNLSLLADFLCIKWKFYRTKPSLRTYRTVSTCAYFIPIFIILSRSSNKVPLRMTGHIFNLSSANGFNVDTDKIFVVWWTVFSTIFKMHQFLQYPLQKIFIILQHSTDPFDNTLTKEEDACNN